MSVENKETDIATVGAVPKSVSQETLVTTPEEAETGGTTRDIEPTKSNSGKQTYITSPEEDTKTDSEETLEEGLTVIRIEPTKSVFSKGAKVQYKIQYKVFPTVPICALTSIMLVVLGCLFLSISASRINNANDEGKIPHTGNYILLTISAFMVTFGILFSFPCFFIPIAACVCPCLGLALICQ